MTENTPIPEMTDDEALSFIAAIMRKHRFTGALFTPTDVRDYLNGVSFGYLPEREITDADINAMLDTWEWRKGITEVLGNEGMDMVANAANDVFDDEGNIRPERGAA